MPILTIRHVTTYHYTRPVAFGEHRMMLRPRDDRDQRVLDSVLKIVPEPSQLAWSRDMFGNHVAVAHFNDTAAELRFESTARLDQAASEFRPADIRDFARTYPFAYSAEEMSDLVHFLTPFARNPRLDHWVAGFLRDDGSADTHTLLVELTQTLWRNFEHLVRHEEGTQAPSQTLELGSGSCRDLAMLMIAALRSLGIAARFVSGYLNLAGHEEEEEGIGGNTHAWVQAYIPGAGWCDFDPSSGIVGNQDLVRVAVARAPHEAIPLQGTWFGAASDHLAMKIAVKVKAAEHSPIGPVALS